MIAIIGLGNPGDKYKGTRHNIGSKAVDDLRKKNGFPGFSLSKRASSEISIGTIAGKDVVLAKPATFMNLSGKAVKDVLKYYRIKPRDLVVLHDDVDIPLGKIKIAKDRGSGGHKGIESVIRELKNKSFARIRIGISPEEKPKDTEIFVLQRFKKEESETAEKAIRESGEAAGVILKDGIEKAASLFNK